MPRLPFHPLSWQTVALMLAVFLLAGCSSQRLTDYADREPQLTPETFFQGDLWARGVVKDWRGRVTRTFDAEIEASWDEDGVGTLDEIFYFDDGEEEVRIWTLTPREDGDGYTGTAGDVVEPGHMRYEGNAIHMNYVLEIAYGDGTTTVRMDDWMYLVTEDTLINRTRMSKWGLTVGEVVLTIHRLPSD